jgi:hypothetical protein
VGNADLANHGIVRQFASLRSAAMSKWPIKIAVLWGLLWAAPVVQAAVCYERSYDQAHLKKHALQEITKMRLILDGGQKLTGRIEAAFRESSSYRGSRVECRVETRATRCEILADGGGFEFTATSKGIRLVNTSTMRFGDEDDGISIGSEAEHRVFLLFDVSNNACQN